MRAAWTRLRSALWWLPPLAGLAIAISAPASAQGLCRPGAYGPNTDSFVVIGNALAAPAQGQRYLFPDGRRGSTAEEGALVSCKGDVATVRNAEEGVEQWARQATRETDASFLSAATRMAGRLIEPAGEAGVRRPLVVMVHGSEKTTAVGNVYAYMFAAQGVATFTYDKRGTGASAGEYTQNFELLAEDAVQALAQARMIAGGRIGRAGFFGGSQGGWVAPLAATRSGADFVAVGFGLVISPIEEDRAQLMEEASAMRLDAAEMAKVRRLSEATATLVRSHFKVGFEQLEKLRQQIGRAPWARRLNGEYSGDMLRMDDAELRRFGRARFDNLELIWDYDGRKALERLNAPLLWVLAALDREAPIGASRRTLETLARDGKPITTYLFPETDHGMFEFRTSSDGTRTPTRITDGYLRLLADWIKGVDRKSYGKGRRLS